MILFSIDFAMFPLLNILTQAIQPCHFKHVFMLNQILNTILIFNKHRNDDQISTKLLFLSFFSFTSTFNIQTLFSMQLSSSSSSCFRFLFLSSYHIPPFIKNFLIEMPGSSKLPFVPSSSASASVSVSSTSVPMVTDSEVVTYKTISSILPLPYYFKNN